MKSSDSEPPCILGLDLEDHSFNIQNIDPCNVVASNKVVPTMSGFSPSNSKISVPAKTKNCLTPLSPPLPLIYDSTEPSSPRRPCRFSEVNGMNEVYIETPNGMDEDDSYGPPVLSPQIELIEDNQMMEVVDYKVDEEEEVEFLWAQPLENKDESFHDHEITQFVKPKGTRRKYNELTSILQKPSKRSSFSYAQYEALFATWEVTQFPHASEVHELVHITGLSLTQVKNWFKNRRMLTRRLEAREGLRQVPFQGQRRTSDSSLSTTSTSHSTTSTGDTSRVQSLVTETDSSSSRSTNLVPQKLTENEKRERRMGTVKCIPVCTLEECMENNKARLSQLVLMYMKKKLDMKRTLLRETAKLKERTAINPFSQNQLNAMRKWREDFFREVGDELQEDKKQKLSYVKANVIEVWQPVITYGKLTNTSLEIAIDDFSRLSEMDTTSIADTEELTVPGILRYMESHFQ